MRSSFAIAAALIALSGCAARPIELGREPALSAVGSGLGHKTAGDVAAAENLAAPVRSASPASTGSLWRESGADLFKDPRARRQGDIVTVLISMKDKATFDNSSKRSRDASHTFGLDMSHAIDWKGWTSNATAKADSTVNSSTKTDGEGAIARAESIDLRVAAVVVDVLPNGNLLVQESQELRVNFELRELTFSGVVNVADIKADNTITYERIAEARMSYGGRGRIMEVQQPAWGQQIVDALFPF